MSRNKVITVVFNTNISGSAYTETQYPELNALLEEGYVVKETILSNPRPDYSFSSITFILTK